MEHRKHKEPPFTKPIPIEQPEDPEPPIEDPDGGRRGRRREKKEKTEKRGWDITRIITKFFSEENEIKE